VVGAILAGILSLQKYMKKQIVTHCWAPFNSGMEFVETITVWLAEQPLTRGLEGYQNAVSHGKGRNGSGGES
jgi:hypothetical protein